MERTYGKAFAASDTWLAMSDCASRGRERKLPGPGHCAGSWTRRIWGNLWPVSAIFKVPIKKATGRRTMMKGRILIIVLLALAGTPVAWAQQPAQFKFSRVVDLTLPIESNMPGIPGIKTYADNPSKVDVVTAITEGQK